MVLPLGLVLIPVIVVLALAPAVAAMRRLLKRCERARGIALYVARRLPSLPIQPSSSRKGRWHRPVLAQAALNRPTDNSGEP
jgi:hypothetical protein